MQRPNALNDAFVAAVHTRATESYCRGDPLPAFPPKPSPPRDPPAPDYISIHSACVRNLIDTLLTLVSFNWSEYLQYFPPCTETAFALTALGLLNDHTHPLHNIFWSHKRRADTASRVQRVIDSGQHLIIPAPWTSATYALNELAAREEARRTAALKRSLALAQASGSKAVSPQKTQTARLTRAAAARQQQAIETAAADASAATSSVNDPKRPRTPPVEALVSAPQRTSARQQKKQREGDAVIPPAVVASTTTTTARPAHTRARSASQESNETLVASTSSSSSSPTSSRAVSVLSADTVVGDVEIVGSKGKERLIVPVPASATEPIGTEAGIVTRSRRKNAPEATKSASVRATPYPATKDAQLTAGRGQSQSKRAPTGKRKVAKGKAK